MSIIGIATCLRDVLNEMFSPWCPYGTVYAGQEVIGMFFVPGPWDMFLIYSKISSFAAGANIILQLSKLNLDSEVEFFLANLPQYPNSHSSYSQQARRSCFFNIP